MPRQARLIISNACYHVMTRGNQKQVVFKQEDDYRAYQHILLTYKKRYNFSLYGWCLMPNHVHLVIESVSLSKVMHGINMTYARYFTNKYNKVGHFWQDRFKSYIIEKDEYLLSCISYIEYNPVRAEFVQKPECYPWSSYGMRILGKYNSGGLLDFFSPSGIAPKLANHYDSNVGALREQT